MIEQQQVKAVYNPVGWHHHGRVHLVNISREYGVAQLTFCGQRWQEQKWTEDLPKTISAGDVLCLACKRSTRTRMIGRLPWEQEESRACSTQ